MSALVKVEQFNNPVDVCEDIDRMKAMARKLMEAKHYQKIGEDGIFAIGMMAKSMGMPVMDALNGEMYYVQGRVGMSAEAMNKRIRMAGHSVSVKRLDDNGCVLIGRRKDTGDTAEIAFGIEDMRSAGKNYEKNRKDMFFARALSRLKRILFPDVACKAYVKEELDDMKRDEDESAAMNAIQVQAVKQLYIEAEQAQELELLRDGCSPEVKKNFGEFMRKKHQTEDLKQLPLSSYEDIKTMLTRRRDDYQKALAEMANKKDDVEAVVEE